MELMMATKRGNWISELPEFIKHRILSFLETKEAVRTSVLSKTWGWACSTRPKLEFNEHHFSSRYRSVELFKFVNQSMQRYQQQKLRIQQFKLCISTLARYASNSDIERWVQVAVENGVEELHLSFKISCAFRGTDRIISWHYPLTKTISLAAKSLVVLHLEKCKLQQPCFVGAIFHSLKDLSLCYVHIDEETFQKLMCSSPSLEILCLDGCFGLNKFHLFGPKKIKKLEIIILDQPELESVDIDYLPSLHRLHITESFPKSYSPKIEVASSENLRHLRLRGPSAAERFLEKFMTKFPHLETIELDKLPRIEISSMWLKHLTIGCGLNEAKIVAPNLSYFHCCGDTMHYLSTEETLICGQAATLSISCPSNRNRDLAWFNNLVKFLKTSLFKRLILWVTLECRITLEDFGEIEIPPTPTPTPTPTDEYELRLHHLLASRKLKRFSEFLAGVLCSCHPETLYLEVDPCIRDQECEEIIKWFRQQLMEATTSSVFPEIMHVSIVSSEEADSKQTFHRREVVNKLLADGRGYLVNLKW